MYEPEKIFGKMIFDTDRLGADLSAAEYMGKHFNSLQKNTLIDLSVEGGPFYVAVIDLDPYRVIVCSTIKKRGSEWYKLVVCDSTRKTALDSILVNDWYSGAAIPVFISSKYLRKTLDIGTPMSIADVLEELLEDCQKNPGLMMSLFKTVERPSNSISAPFSGGLPTLGKRR